jgi:hypothetical protein
MLIAIHPDQPSQALADALAAAGHRTVPVADAAAVAEQEPEGGWGVLVIELGADPEADLSMARRVRRDGGTQVRPSMTSSFPPSTPPSWRSACSAFTPSAETNRRRRWCSSRTSS